MIKPELFDVVELLINLPGHRLQVGAQGAILLTRGFANAEQYSDQKYEVEFTNSAGETLALVTLPIHQFEVVWRAASKTWVPLAEKIEALVAVLPEETRLEVFDFARFVYSCVW
jgi:Domain of unknown function (DUF4926)